MVRPIPEDRMEQLVSAATSVFIELGYRRAQMSDVAERLALGKGTLYGYVESKEALFDAAVRYSDGHVPLPAPSSLPLKTPEAGATERYVRERLLSEVRELALVAALMRPRAPSDPVGELATVLRDLYRRMAANRGAIKLVDRCAVDRPELANVWFGEGRSGQVVMITEYLERRIREGSLRQVASVPTVARTVLETIALWAIHMHWDPSPDASSESEAEDAVIDLLVHALIKETSS